MAALLDVNVLVALFDPAHVHHEAAHAWFAGASDSGWATCPITENGFVRVICSPGYTGRRTILQDARDRLVRFTLSGSRHEFWQDDLSLRDESRFDLGRLLGHRQLTDVYLLGLAVAHGGSLATFDRAIPLAAVVDATAEHVDLIAGEQDPAGSN